MRKHANIHVTGIVQGVGFRPFVYREATRRGLVGYVLNLGDAGVRIIVEGVLSSIEDLISQIKDDPPSISRVDTVDIEWKNPSDKFNAFSIAKSSHKRRADAVTEVPPDIAMCDLCLEDLLNPDSRWYLYPFTSCAACGPRFSTITDLPYDRPYTTMDDFPLCDTCNTGYTDPLDRRYHAQTTACAACGPSYRLLDSDGKQMDIDNPIVRTAELLIDGSILALEGIAGTHLATLTSDSYPIAALRERKHRLSRPFAIMARDLAAVRDITLPTQIEESLLESWRRPIVLVHKMKEPLVVFEHELIAPGLDTIGVMLPYAPLHHLLFRYMDEQSLVMTSANPTGVPMYVDPDTIVTNLKGVADYFLVHDRRINQRADDSVIKVLQKNNPIFIRRARGYVPKPLIVNGGFGNLKVLGLGPEEKVTGTLLKHNYLYPTQYIGDTNRVESTEFLINAVSHAMSLFGIGELDGIACDLHPEFLTTEMAERMSSERYIPLFRVQHHHAHLVSLLLDHNLPLDTSITCITADGYGYGSDGNAWGGEVLVGNGESYIRQGGLAASSLPGGDLTARFAIRSLVGILGPDTDLSQLLNIAKGVAISPGVSLDKENLTLLVEFLNRGLNAVTSTSAGRLLDSVAVLLGICSENSYDGECPMKLEAIAHDAGVAIPLSFETHQKMYQLDTTQFLMQILEMKKQGVPSSDLAFAAQWYLGTGLADIACRVAHEKGTDYVGFSGGVALNRIITDAVVKRVFDNDLKPLIHQQVPPGDGGISIGQVGVGATLLGMK
ncbi:MAG: carbamoyltransferase HypF [Candidatus Thorarchaeota archaeon]